VAFSIADTLNPSQGLGSSGSDQFSIANAYSAGLSSPSPSDPLWLQILYGLQQAASVIDPYILTEQEKAQLELQRLQLELQRAQLQASIRTEPVVPVWVWVVLALLGVALLVVLLRE